MIQIYIVSKNGKDLFFDPSNIYTRMTEDGKKFLYIQTIRDKSLMGVTFNFEDIERFDYDSTESANMDNEYLEAIKLDIMESQTN